MDDDSLSDRRLGAGGLTVGQRFDRLELRFDALYTRLESLATRHDVEILRGRVDVMEREGSWHVRDLLKSADMAATERRELQIRVEALERAQAASVSVGADRRWILGTVLAVLALVVGLMAGYLAHIAKP